MVSPKRVACLLTVATLSSCGAGTVAIVTSNSSGGGGSGSTNQPAIVSNLAIKDTKRESRAEIIFKLIDAESDPANLLIEFAELNGGKSGVIATLQGEHTSPGGTSKDVVWTYGGDFPGLANVRVTVTVTSNPQGGEGTGDGV